MRSTPALQERRPLRSSWRFSSIVAESPALAKQARRFAKRRRSMFASYNKGISTTRPSRCEAADKRLGVVMQLLPQDKHDSTQPEERSWPSLLFLSVSALLTTQPAQSSQPASVPHSRSPPSSSRSTPAAAVRFRRRAAAAMSPPHSACRCTPGFPGRT